ncbi:hypothetical protein ACXZ1K_07365 [Pedobacter sp. PWIIR3]
MKNVATKLLFVIALLTGILSCSKDEGYVENPEEKGLTDCPQGANCTYSYSNNSTFDDATFSIKPGGYRLFWSEVKTPGVTATAFILAPAKGVSFNLGEKEVAEGRLKIFTICPTCFSIPIRVAKGTSKGIQLNSYDANGNRKWLVETKLFIESTDPNAKYADTIHVKQYYYLNQK